MVKCEFCKDKIEKDNWIQVRLPEPYCKHCKSYPYADYDFCGVPCAIAFLMGKKEVEKDGRKM